MISNTVTPGFIKSPFQFSYQPVGGNTSASTPATGNSGFLSGVGSLLKQNFAQPNIASLASQNASKPVTGLVSPSHPAPGTLASDNPVGTHTLTTAPDGTTTTKITYINPDAGGSTGNTTTTGGSSNNPTPTQNTGNGSYPTGGNPYIAPLANTSQAGSQQGQQFAYKTGQYGAGNIPIGQDAAAIAAQYGQKIADVGQKGAAFESGQLTTGTSPVAQGNAAITAQTTAAQQQALATGESAALQGTAQQLTAQNQAANATNEAGGLAYTGQGLQQSGLYNAAGLAQPMLGSIGQVPFSPLNQAQGSPLGAPGGTAADAASVAGQFQGAQAAAAAPGQAQATNIQSGGTAITGANAQGLAQSIQQETELNTAASNATALAGQVKTAMTGSGLDLTNSTDANTAINNLQSRLGNSAYTQLNIAVNDARNAYQAILTSTGATPTDAGAAANQNINANMSPNQILAAIDQLSQGVSARQKSQHQQTQQYQSQLNGSGNSGTSVSGFGWSGNS